MSISSKYKHFIKVNEWRVTISGRGFVLIDMNGPGGSVINWNGHVDRMSVLNVSASFHGLVVLLEALVRVLQDESVLHLHWGWWGQDLLATHVFDKLLVCWSGTSTNNILFASQWTSFLWISVLSFIHSVA
jgi:hypothetical protein